MDEAPNETFFCVFQFTQKGQLATGQFGPLVNSRLTNFSANNVFRHSRLVGDPVGKLVPGRRIRNSGGHREHLAEKLTPGVILGEIQPG